MKALAILSLIGIATVSAGTMPRREVLKGKFGNMEIVDWHDHGMVKTVYSN